MRTSFRSITAFLVATFISLASLAAEADITVTDAIVRAVPPGTPNTAAYMTIELLAKLLLAVFCTAPSA